MDKEFFERKVRELDDDKLIDLLKINNNANQEIIALAKEEAKKRNLTIDLEYLTSTTSHSKFHLDIENNNKLEKWNWGVLLMAPFWILANRLSLWWFLSLFIPIVNVVVIFYLGFNGNKLAYLKSDIESVEDFMTIQKEWSKWGLRLLWISIFISIIFLFAEVIL